MNVLYIHTHDSGRIFSPYGYKVPTPNLEAFAKEAAVFRNAYCAGPTCSPSRAGLLTGTYPHQNGMLGLSQRGFQLDFSKHIVPYFNKNGYRTVLCGIQHEAGWYLDSEQGAKRIGYQEMLTRDNSGFRQEDLVDWDKENASQVCKWLRQYDGKTPFFLSYGMYATHRRFPDKIDDDINENYVLAPYDAVVKDTINKEALKLACPRQCKLSILTAEKAAANLCAEKYDGEKVFIVAKNPKTIRDIYDKGFHMESVNVGNMGGKQNTKMLKKAVSVTKEDMENFLYLADKGVKVTAQMVPADEALDLIRLIRDEQ